MRLWESMQEPCVRVTKTQTADGLGGHYTEWNEDTDSDLMAAIIQDSSNEMLIAEQQGARTIYTITTASSIYYNSYIRRVRDGQLFKIVTDAVHGMGFYQAKAERVSDYE